MLVSGDDAPFADGKALLLPSPPQLVGQTGSFLSGLPPCDGVGFAVLVRCTQGKSVLHSSMDGLDFGARAPLSASANWLTMATDSPERCNESGV